MAKKKLERFAEMETFPNVIQPSFGEVFGRDYHLKGAWNGRVFGNNNPIVLELGCGKGEYTTGLARKFPGKNFIGVDIKGSRIWRGASTALSEHLDNVFFLRTHIEMIQSFFGKDEVDEIWMTFPDPQLKKIRKRLTSPRFLNSYAGFLKPGGMIHLKTDSRELYDYTQEVARYNNLTIICESRDLYHSGLNSDILEIRTFYEQQFIEQGLRIHYLCFALSHGKEIEEPEESQSGQLL